MLIVIIQMVIMLSVTILNVVAPRQHFHQSVTFASEVLTRVKHHFEQDSKFAGIVNYNGKKFYKISRQTSAGKSQNNLTMRFAFLRFSCRQAKTNALKLFYFVIEIEIEIK